MATTKITLTSTWAQVATSAQEFLVENASGYNVDITFADTTPAVGDGYHTLESGEALVRLSLAGAVYVRSSTTGAFVVVTTSE